MDPAEVSEHKLKCVFDIGEVSISEYLNDCNSFLLEIIFSSETKWWTIEPGKESFDCRKQKVEGDICLSDYNLLNELDFIS